MTILLAICSLQSMIVKGGDRGDPELIKWFYFFGLLSPLIVDQPTHKIKIRRHLHVDAKPLWDKITKRE